MSKKAKVIIIIVMVLIILALAAAGVLLYYQGKYIPWLDRIVTVPFFEQAPETVIRAMQKKMTNLSTVHYELASEINWSADQSSLVISSQIVFDGGFKNNMLGQLVAKNEIQIQELSFLANFEVRSTGEKNYFRITEVPAIPFIDLVEVKGQWYEYVPSAAGDDKNASNTQIKNVLANIKMFNIVERLPDEQLEDQLVYHYIAEPDISSIKNLLAVLPPDIKEKVTIDTNGLTGQQYEMWISKQENYLYKLIGTFNNKKITADFTLNASQFDQKVVIEEPADWDTMEDFSEELFNQTNFLEIPLFGYSVGLDTDEFIEDDDEDELYTVWENMFGTDPDNPDSDGDSYKDGQEVRSGYNPKGQGKLFE